MAANKGPTPQEIEYQMQYGALPDTQEELLAYAKENFPFKQKDFDAAMDRIQSLEWSTVSFGLPLVPRPSPRPRTDGNHFYVKGAAENKRIIKRYIDQHIICTRTITHIEAFVPIPRTRFNNAEIYLAEAGLIVPVTMGDVDNFMKTYLDMVQGWLLLNDNLVSEGWTQKRYSLKPRLNVIIDYQIGYDCRYNESRVMGTKGFKELQSKNVALYGLSK